MGYTTKFDGVLAFTAEPTVDQLRELNAMLGEDRREHPEWRVGDNPRWYYLDLCVTADLRGIRWNGSEKSYDMVGQVNFVLDHMRAKWPEFGLAGRMKADGEERDDVWQLDIASGRAVKVDVELPGFSVECPCCFARLRIDPETKSVVE